MSEESLVQPDFSRDAVHSGDRLAFPGRFVVCNNTLFNTRCPLDYC